MFKKILKWVGIIVAALVVLLIVLVGGLYASGQSKMSRTYSVKAEAVAIPKDAAAIERGKRLATMHCTGCHGPDLAGTAFFSDPGLGSFAAKNLTPGKGGIGAVYKDEDFIRTLRHGVRPDGTSVFVMPSNDYYYFSDGDLGDLIAYLKSAPPVDKEWGKPAFAFMGFVLLGAGIFDDSLTATQIDHNAPRPAAPKPGVTADYGAYLVNTSGCRTCHGKNLAGGKDPDPTETILGPNLTPGGELATWKDADFIKLIRTGKTPAGRDLNPAMPWKELGLLTDDELKAIFTYLQSLPKTATNPQ